MGNQLALSHFLKQTQPRKGMGMAKLRKERDSLVRLLGKRKFM